MSVHDGGLPPHEWQPRVVISLFLCNEVTSTLEYINYCVCTVGGKRLSSTEVNVYIVEATGVGSVSWTYTVGVWLESELTSSV